MDLKNKYINMPVQARASISYAICNFFQKGISFLVIPIYIRLLTTAEYGEWAVFQSWAGIIIIFASLNLHAGVYTKTLVDMPDKKERDRYTASMQGLGTFMSLALLAIYFATNEFFNKLIGLDTSFILLLCLYCIVYPAFCFWGTRQRVEYRYKPMVIVTVIVSIFAPVVSIIILQYTEMRAKALVLGFLSTQCVVGGVFYIYHYIKGNCFYDRTYWQYAIKFNLPLIPHYLSLIVLGQSDRIMIKYFCGDSDAGIYSFAYQIASAINVLIASINGSRVPWTYERLKTYEFGRLSKITNLLTVIMAGITLMLCLVTPEIVCIIGTDDYSVGIYVIPVVALGIYFTFIYDIYASIEFYFGATKYVMFASVAGAVLNIILNTIFIPLFGFVAAAYTTLTCYIMLMFMHHRFAKKVLKEQGIHEAVYNDKAIYLLSAILSIVCLVSMATFDYPIVRVALILTIMIACVIKRNNIKEMLVTIKR